MSWKKQYSEQDLATFIEMWGEGCTATEIATKLNKSVNSIRQFASRYREKYNLEKREGGRVAPRHTFDKQWHGVIPLGHWSITKPWGKKCVVKPVTNN